MVVHIRDPAKGYGPRMAGVMTAIAPVQAEAGASDRVAAGTGQPLERRRGTSRRPIPSGGVPRAPAGT